MSDVTTAAGGALDVLPPRPTDAQVERLQAIMATMPQVDCPITDHWADGVYGREMFAPAGTVLVGKRHRHATLNVLLAGRLRVTGADGAVREMVAPAVYTTPPGCKKVALVLEDVRWLNVLPTRLTDTAAIEAKFIEPEPHHLLPEAIP